MGMAFSRRLHGAVALAVLMALAGCQDKASDAPAGAGKPATAGGTAGKNAGTNAETSAGTAAGTPPPAASATGGTPAASASGASAGSTALTGEALARARTCLACHQVNRKQVGPSYQDVAVRFADNPEAVTILASAIRKGGRGQWGAVPMPAQPQVSEAEAAELARWILTLKP